MPPLGEKREQELLDRAARFYERIKVLEYERDAATMRAEQAEAALAALLAESHRVLVWFQELKAQQHEAFDHGLAEAECNWETWQAPSLDLQPLMNLVTDIEKRAGG